MSKNRLNRSTFLIRYYAKKADETNAINGKIFQKVFEKDAVKAWRKYRRNN